MNWKTGQRFYIKPKSPLRRPEGIYEIVSQTQNSEEAHDKMVDYTIFHNYAKLQNIKTGKMIRLDFEDDFVNRYVIPIGKKSVKCSICKQKSYLYTRAWRGEEKPFYICNSCVPKLMGGG